MCFINYSKTLFPVHYWLLVPRKINCSISTEMINVYIFNVSVRRFLSWDLILQGKYNLSLYVYVLNIDPTALEVWRTGIGDSSPSYGS